MVRGSRSGRPSGRIHAPGGASRHHAVDGLVRSGSVGGPTAAHG